MILQAQIHLPNFMHLVTCMKKIVPEFKSQNSEFEILDTELQEDDEVPIYPIVKNA
ncbi:hypothetical protein D3C72_2070060 [compost metagenome]